MFKALFLSLFLLYTSNLLHAQSNETFVLKGNVKNLKENAFELGITGYFRPGTEFIPVDEKGNFFKIIPTDGLQDARIAFKAGELLQFFVIPNDTITLNWDQKDPKQSLKISSPSKDRDSELKLMVDYYQQRFGSFLGMYNGLYKPELSESLKYKLIKDSFHADLSLMKDRPRTKYASKIINEFYYNHIVLLSRMKLLNKYEFQADSTLKPILISQGLSPEQLDYKILNEANFYQSYQYRDFIRTQIMTTRPFKEMLNGGTTRYEQLPTLSNYYLLGQNFLSNPVIKDWYLAKILSDALNNNDLKNVRPLYQQFLKECKSPGYAASLTALYDQTEKLNTGQQAPPFTLKDNHGKLVSLDDFKGKVVVIDFWGVYCPPCREDILSYGQEVHEKYKDKAVVFINICIDEKGDKWKKAIQQLKLTGINLLVEEHRNSAVAKAYNVTSIPHYVLIDSNGKLISNKKISRLRDFTGSQSNSIDQLLAK